MDNPSLRQASLPGLCPISHALEDMASSGNEERGAIFTRREVVDFVLDILGYSVTKRLHKRRLLEPSFGHGDFLLRAIERLLHAWSQENGERDPDDLENAILGIELHQASYETTRERVIENLKSSFPQSTAARLADCWLKQGDFLLIDIPGSFDFAVGNPPYVRTEKIPDALIREYRRRYHTIYDRADLYVPFIERSLSLLADDGQLGFVCSDRWMKNRYGAPLRRMVAEGFFMKYYIDMTGKDAFHSDVTAYPAITVISRESEGVTKVVSKDDFSMDVLQDLSRELLEDATPVAHNPQIRTASGFANGESPWLLSSCEQLALVRRLERDFPTIENAYCRVGIGVATGADKVFIGPFDELDVEEERKIPLATTRDINSGRVSWTGLGIVNPFEESGKLVDLSAYPKLRRFFEQRKADLVNRHVAKRSPRNWYRTIDRIHANLASTPKLLIPDIKGHASIVLEDGRLYPHHNLYFVTSEEWDLEVLLAILRAGLAFLFVSLYSTTMRGGCFRFQAQNLRRICLPRWEDVPRVAKTSLKNAIKEGDLSACRELTATLLGMTDNEKQVFREVTAELV
ncbi:Modification methylase PaeR7I [Planctomycetes bacterium Pan216]|uniref:site-specific DNA-methyltransferase (adenine-specific) n=1 Tax=Kolteria novifilia TaxID=2527975 RepID=A0A518B494_9BACT|nr:Modification methylase PaeR7I [Planctomycetes bacterium Pan216]